MNIDYILKEQSFCTMEGQSFIAKLLQRIPSSRALNTWKREKLHLLWTIFTAPAFFHEVSARNVDVNCIHSSELSNQKVVSWIHEEEFGGTHWVDIIKQTKQQVAGARFSDTLLTALSSSLQKYFHQRIQQVPTDITVVLPTRIERECKHNNNDQLFQNV